MAATSNFVPSAEAAFIAALSDRDMNRVVDEHIVPAALVQAENGRRYARLAAAFARFYFGTESDYSANLRKRVLVELTQRVEQRADRDRVLSLQATRGKVDWLVRLPHGQVDISSFVEDATARAQQVDNADALIHASPDIMDGLPVFAGTRVPIADVIASLDKGIHAKRVTASYPFLTDALISAARVYQQVHPRRGRPRRLADAQPGWSIKETRVLRPAPPITAPKA